MEKTDMVVREAAAPAHAPFAGRTLDARANAGAVAIEQERAIAEAQGQLVLAKKFPRDENNAFAELMKACKSKAFASIAFYAKPRGNSTITGPSVRLAEEVARCYGNFQYGHRELSRDSQKSEVEVFAWDMEKNNRSIRQITVYHVRDTKEGQKPLRDQSDIDEKIANVASKQVRGRILALLPKWLVESAIDECRKTIAGNNDEPVDVRVRKMIVAFSKFGVTASMLERYLGHPLAETTVDELVDLTGVHTALKDGAAPADFFAAEVIAEKAEAAGNAIADAAKAVADKPAPAGVVAAAAASKQAKRGAAKSDAQTTQEPAAVGAENKPDETAVENPSETGKAESSSDSAKSDDGDVF